jgi:pilus assembly protein Flp/PilA
MVDLPFTISERARRPTAIVAAALTMPCKHLAASRGETPVHTGRRRGGMVNQEWAMSGLTKLLRCERAATAIEYALVGSLISIAAIGAMSQLSGKVNTMFNNVANQM